MKILAIDTSCDETSVAVSEDDRLLSNIISSQIELHKKWGGVVPLLARRNHEERINIVIDQALKQAGCSIKEIEIFAITHGPGLAVALEVGVRKVKELAEKYCRPIVAVDHMAGHLYANFTKNKNGVLYSKISADTDLFPLIALLISGGHTEIIYMKDHLEFVKVGQTLDDSIGEAFDKVANMLNLGYPGGPIIEKLAKEGDESRFKFPVPMRHSDDLDFSYSGLKTAVSRVVKEVGVESKKDIPEKIPDMSKDGDTITKSGGGGFYEPTLSKKPVYEFKKKDILDISASFQKSATQALIIKLSKASREYGVTKVLLGGGVVNNIYVRKTLKQNLKKQSVKLFYPQNKKLLSDNAGMISTVAYYMAKRKIFTKPEELDRVPRLSL